VFNPRPGKAVGLPDDTPALTCLVTAADAHCLKTNYSASCFGFGYVELDDCVLVTLRLQLGDLQVYWLAEISDPEVWEDY